MFVFQGSFQFCHLSDGISLNYSSCPCLPIVDICCLTKLQSLTCYTKWLSITVFTSISFAFDKARISFFYGVLDYQRFANGDVLHVLYDAVWIGMLVAQMQGSNISRVCIAFFS
jgi:hypothetical protein